MARPLSVNGHKGCNLIVTLTTFWVIYSLLYKGEIAGRRNPSRFSVNWRSKAMSSYDGRMVWEWQRGCLHHSGCVSWFPGPLLLCSTILCLVSPLLEGVSCLLVFLSHGLLSNWSFLLHGSLPRNGILGTQTMFPASRHCNSNCQLSLLMNT